MVREGLFEEVTLKLRPEGRVSGSHARSILDRGPAGSKVLRWGGAWCVLGPFRSWAGAS